MALSAKSVTPILSGIVGIAMLTMMAGLIKVVSPTVSPPQLMFMVFATMTILLLLVVAVKRLPMPTSGEIKNEILPAAALLAMGACLAVVLAALPFTLIVALLCTAPLIVAGIELGTKHKRDPLVIGGLLAGGIGATIIAIADARTWSPIFLFGLITPVIAAVGIARTTPSSERCLNMAQIALARCVLATLATLPLLALGSWRMPDTVNAFTILLIGFFGVAGVLCLNHAKAHLPSAQQAFIEQTALLWAALIGLITFGEIQPWLFWLGALLVACSAMAIRSRPTNATA